MENNKLSTGLTVWLWIIFVLNILATIGGIIRMCEQVAASGNTLILYSA